MADREEIADPRFIHIVAEDPPRGRPLRALLLTLAAGLVLAHTSDELPYTTAVNVDRFEEDEETQMVSIWATIFVERDSQKGIVVGKQGSMIRRIGTEAR